MSLSVEFQNQFRAAAEAVKSDPLLQEKPAIYIETETLEQMLEPVRDYLDNDAIFGRYETQVYHQLRELREMCLQAQTKHTTSDSELKENRNELLNALQGFVDAASKARGGYVQVDFDYLFALPEKTDVMRGDATIFREYMHSPQIADALEKVADNIDAAHERRWLPEARNDFDNSLDVQASNDEIYATQEIA